MRGATLATVFPDFTDKISIHTPHAGSDFATDLPPLHKYYFNPHSPCGERLAHLLEKVNTFLFQSTLPMRGATGTSTSKINHPADFNPHSPCGERHHKTVSRIQLSEISIHTPHAGSDRQFRKMQRLICISIHTPHAGSDSNLLPSLDRFSNFNPHSPCGERRFTSGIVHSCFVISIHTPHAGSDRWAVGVRHCRSHFNPHSPCGERLRCPYNLFKLADFNPHSPCGERRFFIYFSA